MKVNIKLFCSYEKRAIAMAVFFDKIKDIKTDFEILIKILDDLLKCKKLLCYY